MKSLFNNISVTAALLGLGLGLGLGISHALVQSMPLSVMRKTIKLGPVESSIVYAHFNRTFVLEHSGLPTVEKSTLPLEAKSYEKTKTIERLKEVMTQYVKAHHAIIFDNSVTAFPTTDITNDLLLALNQATQKEMDEEGVPNVLDLAWDHYCTQQLDDNNKRDDPAIYEQCVRVLTSAGATLSFNLANKVMAPETVKH